MQRCYRIRLTGLLFFTKNQIQVSNNHLKMIKKHLLPLLLLIALAFPQEARPQQTAAYDEPNATYNEALALFNKHQYAAAKKLFMKVAEMMDEEHGAMQANAMLHAALSAKFLQHPDAAMLLRDFMIKHPTHPGQKMARFRLGNMYYRTRDYEEAARWYAGLNTPDIDRPYREEFLFKKGYSYYMTDAHTLAGRLLRQITNPASPHYYPATYYSGHIAYQNEDYDTALRAFREVADDRFLGSMVPYYIAHIHFLQKNYPALLEEAPGLLEDASARQLPDISKLLGETYFILGNYEQAIPYLETYIRQSRAGVRREDHYQLGFASFSAGQHELAIQHLERVTGEDDTLAQNAYYHLAASYIETGQKRYARNAFLHAHQMDHDPDISREGLFHYALLSLELSYDPYNEAIIAFRRYIETYPESPRTEEAYEHLTNLYLTTRNYKEALRSLEGVPLATTGLREAFQRVSYYRGVELFNNGDFDAAIDHFARSRRYNENRSLFASALYWEAEAQYRKGGFAEAIRLHEAFLVTPGAFNLDFYNKAHYSIGYANFQLERYGPAIQAFRNFLGARGGEPRLMNDASLRAADAYFMTKQYQPALDYYQRAAQLGVIDTDYAVFQQGLVYGIIGRFEDKISTMQQLISRHPRSSYLDNARYEIANTWLLLEDNNRAMGYFNELMAHHPNSSFIQSAMLKTGLVYYNINEDEKALEMFREVVEKYPGTPQSREALSAMQIIYVQLDRVQEYVRFTEERGLADITRAQEDSLSYQAAENRYMQGNCTDAIPSFSNYLERFPDGIFAAHAHYYRAECYFRINEFERSLGGYEYIIEGAYARFLENSLVRAASIEYGMQHFQNALHHFLYLSEIAETQANTIIAREGLMRSHYRLQQFDAAGKAAGRVLELDRISREVEQEAHLIRGISALRNNDHETARESLQQARTMTSNILAAEAMYYLAYITFRQGDYQAAEEQIFEYSNQLSAYDYWLARIFLLLADVYIEQGNTFQARHTLESLINNYDGEEILEQAKARLAFVLEQEQMERGTGHSENNNPNNQ